MNILYFLTIYHLLLYLQSFIIVTALYSIPKEMVFVCHLIIRLFIHILETEVSKHNFERFFFKIHNRLLPVQFFKIPTPRS